MPRLSCWSCGRQIYTVAPLESLFAEERRCPRCGAFLREDRRGDERRVSHRRTNPPHDPGPPKPRARPRSKVAPKGAAGSAAEVRPPAAGAKAAVPPPPKDAGPMTPEERERRRTDRRVLQRRGAGLRKPPSAGGSGQGRD